METYLICTQCGETNPEYFIPTCTIVERERSDVYGMPWSEYAALSEDAKLEHVMAHSSLGGLLGVS